MKYYIIGIFLLIVLLIYIPPMLYFKFGWFKKFYHNLLGWHQPTKSFYFDGCNTHSTCKYCGKEIMRDSQGNWFS